MPNYGLTRKRKFSAATTARHVEGTPQALGSMLDLFHRVNSSNVFRGPFGVLDVQTVEKDRQVDPVKIENSTQHKLLDAIGHSAHSFRYCFSDGMVQDLRPEELSVAHRQVLTVVRSLG